MVRNNQVLLDVGQIIILLRILTFDPDYDGHDIWCSENTTRDLSIEQSTKNSQKKSMHSIDGGRAEMGMYARVNKNTNVLNEHESKE